MEYIVCSECKGRKFRKISNTEYECEYCGAIIKEAAKPEAPKIVIVQQQAPQQIVTPFPGKVSYDASYRDESMKWLAGKLIIYPDKYVFVPRCGTSTREWCIKDIVGYEKVILGVLLIKMKDGKIIPFSARGNPDVIINMFEERRKYFLI